MSIDFQCVSEQTGNEQEKKGDRNKSKRQKKVAIDHWQSFRSDREEEIESAFNITGV